MIRGIFIAFTIFLLMGFISFIETIFPMISVTAEISEVAVLLLIFISTYILRFLFIYYIFTEILKINPKKRFVLFAAYPLLLTDVVINHYIVKTPSMALLEYIYPKIASINLLLPIFISINIVVYDLWRFLFVYFYCKE